MLHEASSLVRTGRRLALYQLFSAGLEWRADATCAIEEIIREPQPHRAAPGANMATIFISYASRDQQYADILSRLLTDADHRIYYGGNLLSAGKDMSATIDDAMEKADVFVVLVSSASVQSANIMMELARAKVQAEARLSTVIPLLIEDIPVPGVFRRWGVVFGYNIDVTEVFGKLLTEISSFEESKKEAAARKKEVEHDLSEFVEHAIQTQRNVGKTNRRMAYGCYTGGALALGAGLWTTFEAFLRATDATFVLDTGRMISAGLANVVAIGFLGALAKYGYSLGKSFMSEALKSSDRIHAIQFGQFYLKAFGSRLSPAEVRDAFQHWNIDRNSTFSALDSSEIDPQIISLAGQIAAVALGKKSEK